jgi:hypothetical protein
MALTGGDLSDLNAGLAQMIDITLGCETVGNHPVDGRWRRDAGEAAAAEFARVANRDDDASNIDHGAIHFCFEEVWRAQAVANVEAIYSQEKNVGMQAM